LVDWLRGGALVFAFSRLFWGKELGERDQYGLNERSIWRIDRFVLVIMPKVTCGYEPIALCIGKR